MSKVLTGQDFQNAAASLGVSVAHIRAVDSVESNGNGFLADGRVKVQYEPHVMYQRLKEHFGASRAAAELKAHPDLVATKAGSYQSADKEDKDMDRAVQAIDRTSALEAASWGAYQIMGYHWSTCGYPSIQAFVNAMQTAPGQLDAFVRFVKADRRLVQALKAQDWATFARIYNGPGYAANRYDTKMAAAFAQHSRTA